MVTENGIVLKRGYIDGFCRQSFIRDLQIKEEYDTMKNSIKRKDNIKSVTLVIDAYNGRKLEIPLEVWQVDVIREMLGLSVDTTNLDTYCMRSKEQTNETNYTDIINYMLFKYDETMDKPILDAFRRRLHFQSVVLISG